MFASIIQSVKDYLKGIFLYNMISGLYNQRRQLDEFFMFSLFGKTIGFPHLFNFYHLRLIPYYVPRFEPWKRSILKEKDFFDYVSD